MPQNEDAIRAGKVYSNLDEFHSYLTQASRSLLQAVMDTRGESFGADAHLKDFQGLMNIVLTASIRLKEEWRGYYEARKD